jgi:A1 cistron-splicing factor AAR2
MLPKQMSSTKNQLVEGVSSANGGSNSILIIPDVPIGLDFGINCMSFETGPKFRGMSMIPQGLHFIYHSTGMAARQGFFWRAGVNDVAVRPWDSFEEHICPTNKLSEDSMYTLLQQLGRGDLNNNLGPYPLADHHVWLNMSCFISENVLLRANCPIAEIVYPSEADDLVSLKALNRPGKNFEPMVSKQEKDKTLLQGNFAKFVDITAAEVNLRDTINVSSNLEDRGRNLTSLYLDKSSVLDNLVEKSYDFSWENILGEMQLSFILFLLIFCHDALEHWKRLVDTICRSEVALIDKPEFAIAFMRILYEQLNFSPQDFFANELSKDNFLRPAISSLFEILNQPKGVINSSVREHKKRLLNFFRKKFNIFLDSENEDDSFKNTSISDNYNLVDEDKPVVVSIEDITALGIDINLDQEPINTMEIEETKDINIELKEIAIDFNNDNHKVDLPALTPSEIELGMFSWRYPNLYDALVACGLNEDLEMAAVRILEEADQVSKRIRDSIRVRIRFSEVLTQTLTVRVIVTLTLTLTRRDQD